MHRHDNAHACSNLHVRPISRPCSTNPASLPSPPSLPPPYIHGPAVAIMLHASEMSPRYHHKPILPVALMCVFLLRWCPASTPHRPLRQPSHLPTHYYPPISKPPNI